MNPKMKKLQTWGVDIFENDVAVQIREDFNKAIDEGLSVYAAGDRIIQKYADSPSVPVYLALAALQLEHDLIQPKVKKKALTLIISGDAAEIWEDAGTAVYELRKEILHKLRMKLLSVPT